jgi:hypothetical protein
MIFLKGKSTVYLRGLQQASGPYFTRYLEHNGGLYVCTFVSWSGRKGHPVLSRRKNEKRKDRVPQKAVKGWEM